MKRHAALVLKAQKGSESSSDDMPLPKRDELGSSGSLGELFRIILGFAVGLYGFLMLVDPNRYPISFIPVQYTQLAGLALLILGAYLLLKS